MTKFFFHFFYFRGNNELTVCRIWMARKIVLVVILCREKSASWRTTKRHYFGNNPIPVLLVDDINVVLCFFFLTLGRIKNCRLILRTHVISLFIGRCRIVCRKKHRK